MRGMLDDRLLAQSAAIVRTMKQDDGDGYLPFGFASGRNRDWYDRIERPHPSEDREVRYALTPLGEAMMSLRGDRPARR